MVGWAQPIRRLCLATPSPSPQPLTDVAGCPSSRPTRRQLHRAARRADSSTATAAASDWPRPARLSTALPRRARRGRNAPVGPPTDARPARACGLEPSGCCQPMIRPIRIAPQLHAREGERAAARRRNSSNSRPSDSTSGSRAPSPRRTRAPASHPRPESSRARHSRRRARCSACLPPPARARRTGQGVDLADFAADVAQAIQFVDQVDQRPGRRRAAGDASPPDSSRPGLKSVHSTETATQPAQRPPRTRLCASRMSGL